MIPLTINNFNHMKKNKESKIHGRVRRNTSENINEKIDRETLNSLGKHHKYTDTEISNRLKELKKEWDIERTLEVNASALAFVGILLGSLVNKKWLVLPGIVTLFLFQHGIQGWCPPLPLFRAMGIRSRQEIDEEKYALKIIRGDFDSISSKSSSKKIFRLLRNRISS